MKYILWHTPRAGSNLLSNLLHKTGVAGIADYEKCGFWVGNMSHMKPAEFWRLSEEYFAMQTTPNGVSGCKGGISFVEQIAKHVGRKHGLRWALSFEKHVVLKRRNILAQAVSGYFAGHTKIWTSQSPPNDRPLPDYNYNLLAFSIATIAGEVIQTEYFLNEYAIRYLTVYYEDLIVNMEAEVDRITRFLGIKDAYIFREPDIQKQKLDLKDQYIQRYLQNRAYKQIPEDIIT